MRSVHESIWYYNILTMPGTQMTLVLNGKGLFLEGSNTKIEDISRFQVYNTTFIHRSHWYTATKGRLPVLSHGESKIQYVKNIYT